MKNSLIAQIFLHTFNHTKTLISVSVRILGPKIKERITAAADSGSVSHELINEIVF